MWASSELKLPCILVYHSFLFFQSYLLLLSFHLSPFPFTLSFLQSRLIRNSNYRFCNSFFYTYTHISNLLYRRIWWSPMRRWVSSCTKWKVKYSTSSPTQQVGTSLFFFLFFLKTFLLQTHFLIFYFFGHFLHWSIPLLTYLLTFDYNFYYNHYHLYYHSCCYFFAIQISFFSTGNILDDTVLIETLAESKKTSEEINEKIRESNLITIEISIQSELYRPVAKR